MFRLNYQRRYSLPLTPTVKRDGLSTIDMIAVELALCIFGRMTCVFLYVGQAHWMEIWLGVIRGRGRWSATARR